MSLKLGNSLALQAEEQRSPCGLTLELSGRQRHSAWPARCMMNHCASRAKRYAVDSPLERLVRPAHSGAARARRAEATATEATGCPAPGASDNRDWRPVRRTYALDKTLRQLVCHGREPCTEQNLERHPRLRVQQDRRRLRGERPGARRIDRWTHLLRRRGLTLELSGPRRQSAWPARCMMNYCASRAKCFAVAGPLERPVRPARTGAACDRRANTTPREATALPAPGASDERHLRAMRDAGGAAKALQQPGRHGQEI